MNLLKRYIREALAENARIQEANEYSWRVSTKKKMLLDKEGMEKSDKDNVESFLKSMSLMENFKPVLSMLPDGVYKFPIVPPPPRFSKEEMSDLLSVIEQHKQNVVPSSLQEKCDTDIDGLFEDYLSSQGIVYNVSYYSKLKKDLVPVIRSLKSIYDRPRPQEIALMYGIPFRDDDLDTAKSPSYPSGHTIQGYVLALLLSEQFPEERENLLNIAEMIGQSRIDRGVHFPSDLSFGRMIAYLMVEEILDESSS